MSRLLIFFLISMEAKLVHFYFYSIAFSCFASPLYANGRSLVEINTVKQELHLSRVSLSSIAVVSNMDLFIIFSPVLHQLFSFLWLFFLIILFLETIHYPG